jgi:PII-like signaling protein
MPAGKPARLLRIHLSESDRYQGAPAYEAVLAKCREMGVAGATVFRGLEGFGETAEVHKQSLLHRDLPIVIVAIDEAESVERLIAAIEPVVQYGMIAVSDVRVTRVNRGAR